MAKPFSTDDLWPDSIEKRLEASAVRRAASYDHLGWNDEATLTPISDADLAKWYAEHPEVER